MSKRLQIMLYNADPYNLDTITRNNKAFEIRSSLTFPINPENITDTYERNVSEVKLLNNEESYQIGKRKTKRYTIKCTLPEKDFVLANLNTNFNQLNYTPYVQGEIKKLLNKWWKNQTILRFIVSDDINLLCRIAKYSIEIFESTPDINCTIELVEAYTPTLISQTLNNSKLGFTKLKQRIKTAIKDNHPIVAQKGQTIYKIAKLYYNGDFMELAKLNGLENDLNKDIAGMVINFGTDIIT